MTSFLKYNKGVLILKIVWPKLGNCLYKQEIALSRVALVVTIARKRLDPI